LDIHETIEELPIVKKGRKKKFQIIGQIGAGKNMVNGIIDVAIMQSLFYEKEVKPFVKDYGMVIVDECHHISASSFNKILNEIMATYVYGLSATPIRKDGHHPNIFMQCGPIRFRVDAKKQAEQHSFEHYVVPRFTSFRKPIYQDEKEWHISDVYRLLSEDQLRNQLILKDILDCISKGRTPIVLTERTAHAQLLSELLLSKGQNVITLTGKLSEKERSKIEDITHSFFDKGFNIMFHKDLTQKFIVIDNQLIWYGNLNMLGFQKDDDSAMRLINLEIAQELMQIVDGEE